MAVEHALFGVVPIIVTSFLLYYVLSTGQMATDFREEFWVAGSRLVHGGSLYSWGPAQFSQGITFVYPALTALLFAPFAVLPVGASSVLWMALCLAAVWATLHVLKVRDWRVYGVVLLWAPVIHGWQTGNVTTLLALGLAAVWRYRDRPAVAGLVTAFVVSLKPFMWPLALWLLVTRRYRAFLQMAFAAVVINAAAWAVVGPGQLHSFFSLNLRVSDVFYRSGYGVPALVAQLGFTRTAGTCVEIAVALLAVLACFRAGRRKDDFRAFVLVILVMLLASPLVWIHYLALLVVPIAIFRPRLGLPYLLPVLLVVCPDNKDVHLWQVLTLWVVGSGCFIYLLSERRTYADAPNRPEPANPVPSGFRAFLPNIMGSSR